MPAVSGRTSNNTSSAISRTPGEKNASSQPYPVTQSSGRHKSPTWFARASAIAARILALFASQSSGVWFKAAALTLISLIRFHEI
jgi:hypothetical protein